MSSICRSCWGPLRFIRMRTGNTMPCEPTPDRNGNIAAMRTSQGKYVDGHVIGKDADRAALAAAEYVIFMPHWAACPEARKANQAAKPERDPDQGQLFPTD